MHIYILGPKLLQWNFFKFFSYLNEVVLTNFSPIFGLLAIFNRNLAKIVAPPSDKNENYAVHLKENAENCAVIGL